MSVPLVLIMMLLRFLGSRRDGRTCSGVSVHARKSMMGNSRDLAMEEAKHEVSRVP